MNYSKMSKVVGFSIVLAIVFAISYQNCVSNNVNNEPSCSRVPIFATRFPNTQKYFDLSARTNSTGTCTNTTSYNYLVWDASNKLCLKASSPTESCSSSDVLLTYDIGSSSNNCRENPIIVGGEKWQGGSYIISINIDSSAAGIGSQGGSGLISCANTSIQ